MPQHYHKKVIKKVALADADNQKSSLQWLKQRPETVTAIQSLDWRHEKSIGDIPASDYLIIDAPGALSGEHAEQLVSEAHAIVTPLQPSFLILIVRAFVFWKHLQDIKRIRKGKSADSVLIANRVKPNSSSSKDIQDFLIRLNKNLLRGFQNVALTAHWQCKV